MTSKLVFAAAMIAVAATLHVKQAPNDQNRLSVDQLVESVVGYVALSYT